MKNNLLIERIARNHCPMVKYLHTKGLTLRIGSQIGLKAKAVHDRNIRLKSIEGSTRFGSILHNMPSSSRQYRVNCLYHICRGLHFHEINLRGKENEDFKKKDEEKEEEDEERSRREDEEKEEGEERSYFIRVP